MIQRIFFAHPATVNETYFQHMAFAIRFSFRLFGAALAAMVHAFVPCLCEKTASRTINDLHLRMHNRGH